VNPPGTLPVPADVQDGRVRADVVVIGAGVAGLYAATLLPEGLDVLIVDKGVAGGDSGSSPWAQGGLAAAIDPADSPAAHAADTLAAGDHAADPAAVEVLTREAPGHVRRLLELGAQFDRRPGHLGSMDPAHLDLALEGGHHHHRCVRRADATGAELVRVLRAAAAPRVRRLEAIALTLARGDDGRVHGAWVLHGGAPVAVEARAVLLATGGCGGLFAATTNPEHATADGLALAAGAGAALRDLEFVQFHPTGLAVPGTWRFLLTEALRGAGATLHGTDGARFLDDVHPDAELAPRHVVARAILDRPDGMAWLDATHLGEDVLVREFPTVLAGARRHGYDLATERVPVTPAAHYQVGGVRTDLEGRTSVPGLWAAGEVASTGVHGANRMAGNSLTEALVFGARAARSIAADLPPASAMTGPAPDLRAGPAAQDPVERRRALREAMLEHAGPVRDAPGLERLAGWLEDQRRQVGAPTTDPADVEVRHALVAARLLVRAARLRTETRGGHHRRDHPERDPRWDGLHLELTDPPTGP
jgi:L-aspartate oxidase